jgi:hypothetical protein
LAVVLVAVEIGDVAAGDERAVPRSSDDHYADRLVALERNERRFEFQQGRNIQRVQRFLTIDVQDAGPCVSCRQYCAFTHGNSLFRIWVRAVTRSSPTGKCNLTIMNNEAIFIECKSDA